MIAYHFAGGMNQNSCQCIYEVFDFNNPFQAIALIVIMFIGNFITHKVVILLQSIRIWIYEQICMDNGGSNQNKNELA
jgi:hypothetical protein